MTTKIAIDVTPCAYAPMSGTGMYVRSLVTELLALNSGIELHLISSKHCDLGWARNANKWFGGGELARHNVAWWAISGNRLLSKIGADVFWSPFQFFPIGMSSKRRSVLTVLDLVWYHMPLVMEWKNCILNKKMMRRSIKRASAIITISNTTRNDLLGRFKLDEKKVHSILLSASSDFGPSSEPELASTRQKYPVCVQPFILAVGALEPRKNHLRLVQAIERLRQDGIKCNLIIAGSSGWKNEELFSYLNKNSSQEWVHILKDVGQKDLKSLYNMAELLAFPSLMEGFGIPIVEAMFCGCPVVTSNISSMPEVADNAAVLVNPYDVDDIASGVLRAIKRKDELRNLGLDRAKQFSWKISAEKHLEVLLG